MNIYILSIFSIILFTIEVLYFKIADKYNIIDKPNYRSSHTQITLRGGGIIFSISVLIGAMYLGFRYPYFIFGLVLITLVSFIDDINPVSNKVRIICHLIAVSILFNQLNIYLLSCYWIIINYVFVIGTINAINFMDGINGITGLYGLVTIITLYYINLCVIPYTENTYLITSILSLCVFNFFNFRKNAKCFAGDVGSVSLAFIVLFFMLQLIVKTNDFKYLLLLLIYGLDVVTTIFFRLYRRENVFDAHRTHFYQFLANETAMPHLAVSLMYGLAQLLIDFVLVNYFQLSIFGLLMSVFISTAVFIVIRFYFEGHKKLLGKA